MVYKEETGTLLVSLKSFQPNLGLRMCMFMIRTSDNYTGSAMNCKQIVTERTIQWL